MPTDFTRLCVLTIISVVVVATAGCAETQDVTRPAPLNLSTAGDINAALRGVKTVSLHPKARLVGPAQGRSPERLKSDTDRAILQEFHSHGYAVDRIGAGDIEIAYAIGHSTKFDDTELYKIFGVAPGLDRGDSGARGAIALVLYDPRTSNIEWRAGISAPIPEEGIVDEDKRYERIVGSVRQLLSGLRDRQ